MAMIAPPTGFNDRVKLDEVLPIDSPFTLNVFPTNACNLKCNYCVHSMGKDRFSEYPHMRGGNMSIQTFIKIVESSESFKQKFKLLSFMGHGEPLLNPLLPDMISLAAKALIAERIEIISNGLLLTNELSRKLVDAGLDNLRISLQGINDQQYYDTAQKKICFSDFLEKLKYFHEYGRERGTKLFVKVLDCSLTKGQEEEFFNLFNDRSDRMYIEQVKPVYKGVTFTRNITDLSTDRYGTAHDPRAVCPLPFFTMAIWPNGDIAPCDAIYLPVNLGNVHSTELADAFNGEKMRSFREVHLRKNRNTLPGCSVCCAPDDVSHPMDELDTASDRLLAAYM